MVRNNLQVFGNNDVLQSSEISERMTLSTGVPIPRFLPELTRVQWSGLNPDTCRHHSPKNILKSRLCVTCTFSRINHCFRNKGTWVSGDYKCKQTSFTGREPMFLRVFLVNLTLRTSFGLFYLAFASDRFTTFTKIRRLKGKEKLLQLFILYALASCQPSITCESERRIPQRSSGTRTINAKRP